MKTLILCQLCQRAFDSTEEVCHPEHSRTIECSVTRDRKGRVIDCAEASPRTQMFRAAKAVDGSSGRG